MSVGYGGDAMVTKGLQWLIDEVRSFASGFGTMQRDQWAPQVWVTVNSTMPADGEDALENACAKRKIASEEMSFPDAELDYPTGPGLFVEDAIVDDNGGIMYVNAMGSMTGITTGAARCVCLIKRWLVRGSGDQPNYFRHELLYVAKASGSVEENKPVLINTFCIRNHNP